MRKLLFLTFTLIAGSLSAQKLDSLSIKIGQMILMGFPAAEVDTSMLSDVRSGKVGNLIIFEKNVPKSATAFSNLKKIIWTYQKVAPIPLLVGIDQEGGRVNRLKDKYGFPKSVTAFEMGKSKNLDSVQFYAESIASNLAGLGINVNFAPVVDLMVSKSKSNPIFAAGRSFSAQADSVTVMAREYIKPHRKFGVATVLKHFPGHGSAEGDTHFGIADVSEYWKDYELSPYRSLLKDGYVDAIMSAHIVNRNLDPSGYPGTLSKRILDSLLRKQLKFDGVVFSDDMQMQAITKQYPLEESIKRAINAGIDILCFANNIPISDKVPADRIHFIIREAVKKGDIPMQRIDQSYRRVIKLKAQLVKTDDDFKQEIVKLQGQLKEKDKAISDLQEASAASSSTKKKKKSKKKN